MAKVVDLWHRVLVMGSDGKMTLTDTGSYGNFDQAARVAEELAQRTGLYHEVREYQTISRCVRRVEPPVKAK